MDTDAGTRPDFDEAEAIPPADEHLSDDEGGAEESAGDPPPDAKNARAAMALVDRINAVVRDGVGPVTGSVAWAEARLKMVQGTRYDHARANSAPTGDIEKVISRLITESVTASASAGFLTGLGGLITLPITLPANIAGSLIINVRLAGAIAHMRGYDLKDPHTQAMIPLVALGSSVQASLSAIGSKIGVKLGEQAIKKLSIETVRAINRRAGFMLIAKYGTKRAPVVLVRAVPFVGGVVGGGVDAVLTGMVGRVAKQSFSRLD